MRVHFISAYMVACLVSACGGGNDGGSGGGAVSNLECNGNFNGLPAAVSGTRRLEAVNALGDGYVTFNGTLTTPSESAPLRYEDYSNLGPYEGVIQSQSFGNIPVSVLDATGDNNDTMLIYSDVPSTGPPTILGQFICAWF